MASRNDDDTLPQGVQKKLVCSIKPPVVIENQHSHRADHARDGSFEIVPGWFVIER